MVASTICGVGSTEFLIATRVFWARPLREVIGFVMIMTHGTR